jgi:NADH dehydrogenase FAD-containing subunit
MGERIAVIDEEYGFQGPSAAELLLDAGKSVELITSMEAICTLLGATTRPPVYQRLFHKGIVIHPHLHVRAIEGDTLITENAWAETKGELTGYDAVVYAFGGQAVDEISQLLQNEVTCSVVGDAFAPRTLQHAIMEGHTFARKI